MSMVKDDGDDTDARHRTVGAGLVPALMPDADVQGGHKGRPYVVRVVVGVI